MASVDPEEAIVTLESGLVLKGDVVIGTDGPNGITRQHVIQAGEEDKHGDLMMFKQVYMPDLNLRELTLSPVQRFLVKK